MNTLKSALEPLIGKDVYVKLILDKSFNGTLETVGSDFVVLNTSGRPHIIPFTAIAHVDPNSSQI